MQNKHRTSKRIVIAIVGITAILMIGKLIFNDAKKVIDEITTDFVITEESEEVSEDRVTQELLADIPVTGKEDEELEEVETVEPTEAITENKSYSDSELNLLSRIIYAEAGSSWLSDEFQRMVGSVVLNRVKSSYFPSTIYNVIYQKGAYAPTRTGAINNTPDDRTIENAKYILENGSILPENVVYQSCERQGSGVYSTYYDSILGTTTYFCYL